MDNGSSICLGCGFTVLLHYKKERADLRWGDIPAQERKEYSDYVQVWPLSPRSHFQHPIPFLRMIQDHGRHKRLSLRRLQQVDTDKDNFYSKQPHQERRRRLWGNTSKLISPLTLDHIPSCCVTSILWGTATDSFSPATNLFSSTTVFLETSALKKSTKVDV